MRQFALAILSGIFEMMGEVIFARIAITMAPIVADDVICSSPRSGGRGERPCWSFGANELFQAGND
ncbi:hypothetical protein WL27_22105 [Burkholderia multivorans]|nr:hypothetical protein WL27_22105 [Burkholderia multivorans]